MDWCRRARRNEALSDQQSLLSLPTPLPGGVGRICSYLLLGDHGHSLESPPIRRVRAFLRLPQAACCGDGRAGFVADARGVGAASTEPWLSDHPYYQPALGVQVGQNCSQNLRFCSRERQARRTPEQCRMGKRLNKVRHHEGEVVKIATWLQLVRP